MKEKFKKFWKENGFYTVLTSALVIVLSISGIAGYRSGIYEKNTAENAAQNAAEFEQAGWEAADEDAQAANAGAEANQTSEETAHDEAVAADGSVTEMFDEESKLLMPTQGEVLKPFSMDTTIYFETLDQYKCNPAMLIKADVNQEVVAAFGGTVTSITEDRVNGLVITVDMGNGYQAVYGQMKDIDVKEEQVIVKGQAMGSVAQPTTYFSEEGSHLYFGVTKDDVPVNPEDYLEN